MELEVFEGKTREEAKAKALEALEVEENEVYLKEEEKKGGLFKSTTYKCSVIKITDIAEFVKEKASEIVSNMGIDANFESNVRDEQINMIADQGLAEGDRRAVSIKKAMQESGAVQNNSNLILIRLPEKKEYDVE